MLCKNWYLLGEKIISNDTHKISFEHLRLFVWKLPRAQGLGKWPECPYFKYRFRFYSFAMFSVKKSTRSDDTQ